MTPVVTVGIPFFDEERWLAAAVRSILGQTMRDIEVLLVDDGSRDRSLEIARSFDDPRIRVFSDGAHRGLPARLNEIARLARADIVARMDADDVVHATRLSRQLAKLEEASFDAVGAWAALVDDQEEVFAVIEAPTMVRKPEEVLDLGVFPHATMLARRSWLRANPYDETLTRAEDRELFCRTIRSARFAVVPEILYVVRVSSRGSRFLSDYRASHAQNRTIFRRFGPEFIGVPKTVRKIAASYAKSFVMTLAVHAGQAEKIVRRRGRQPRPAEVELVREALAAGAGR